MTHEGNQTSSQRFELNLMCWYVSILVWQGTELKAFPSFYSLIILATGFHQSLIPHSPFRFPHGIRNWVFLFPKVKSIKKLLLKWKENEEYHIIFFQAIPNILNVNVVWCQSFIFKWLSKIWLLFLLINRWISILKLWYMQREQFMQTLELQRWSPYLWKIGVFVNAFIIGGFKYFKN